MRNPDLRPSLLWIFSFLFVFTLLTPGVGLAQETGCELQYLPGPKAHSSSYYFGRDVDCSGDTCVTAYIDGFYTYSWNGSNSTLTNTIGGQGNTERVCIDDDLILSCQPELNRVRVYRRTLGVTFVFEQELTLPDSIAGDRFGEGADVDGHVIAVGRPASATGSGSVTIFRFDGSTWVADQTILPNPAADVLGNRFGASIALEGNLLAISAPGDDIGLSEVDSGSIHVYHANGSSWSPQATLFSLDYAGAQIGDGDLIFDGDRIAAGGWRYNGNRGLVLIWNWNAGIPGGGGGPPQAVLEPVDLQAGEQFGYSLDLDGDRLLVGSPTRPGGAASGAVRLFTDTGSAWVDRGFLPESGGDTFFGSSVAICRDLAFIGHQNDNTIYNGLLEGSQHFTTLFDHSIRPTDLIDVPVSPATVDQFVEITTCTNLYGFSFGFSFDPLAVQYSSIDLVGTVSETIGAEFFAPELDNLAGIYTVGCLLDLVAPLDKFISPGANWKAVRGVLTVDAAIALVEGPESTFSIASGVGNPVVDLYFSIPGPLDTVPETHGAILDLPVVPRFLRGDINDSGFLNITDPVFLLFYLFGEPVALICESTADVNDDGVVDMADPIFLLNVLYVAGSPAIPEPSSACGVDPTVDTLTCESSSCP